MAYIDLAGTSAMPAGLENPYAGELGQPAAPIAEISRLLWARGRWALGVGGRKVSCIAPRISGLPRWLSHGSV